MFTRWNYLTICLFYLKILNTSPCLYWCLIKTKILVFHNALWLSELLLKQSYPLTEKLLFWGHEMCLLWGAQGGWDLGDCCPSQALWAPESDCIELLPVPHFPLLETVFVYAWFTGEFQLERLWTKAMACSFSAGWRAEEGVCAREEECALSQDASHGSRSLVLIRSLCWTNRLSGNLF